MPGQGAGHARPRKARAERDVGAPVADRGEETRELNRSIAVVAVEEHDNVRCAGVGEPCQAGPAVSAARFADHTRAHARGDLSGSIARMVIDDKDFSDEAGGEIGEDAADRPRLVACGNDDRNSHSTSV